ncbi:ATP-binding protein [Nonomuraea antimicrobica]|uniref:ATP-binding protein n=1 Tax=Nonomuraea antimicrobica TaxID=561173 RepID=UPI0031F02B9A
MLVGRESEQERIARLLSDARLGRSGALAIHGEAGIGKSASSSTPSRRHTTWP